MRASTQNDCNPISIFACRTLYMCFDYQDITHTCFYVNNFYNANTLIPFLQRRKIASVFLSGSRGATGPGRPARRGPARPGRPGAGPDRPFVPGKYGGQFLLKMKGFGEKYGGSQIGDGPVDYCLRSTDRALMGLSRPGGPREAQASRAQSKRAELEPCPARRSTAQAHAHTGESS